MDPLKRPEPIDVHYQRVQRAVIALRGDIVTHQLADDLVGTLQWFKQMKGIARQLSQGIHGDTHP